MTAILASVSMLLVSGGVIEIERASQIELHVFDAKLNVEGVVSLGSESDAADDEDEQAIDPLKFKKEDIAKMHAYRDALPYVRSLRVLYPGNVVREFRLSKQVLAMPTSLERSPSFRDNPQASSPTS